MTLWIHNGSQQLDEISDYRTILGVCIALPILMVVIVGMRAYTRIKLLHSIGLDDWIIFFSTVSSCSRVLSSFVADHLYQLCAIIYAGLCIGQSTWGLGLPLSLRPKDNINQYSVVRRISLGQTVDHHGN